MTERVSAVERRYVAEVLDSEFRSSSGMSMCTRLEQAFAGALGSEFAISFVNGTATLHAALVAAGIGAGDEVIVPPLTMASTAFAVIQAGAEPVFADVERETFTLDPRSVEEHLSDRTKGTIPVALYGLSPDMDPLMALAEKHGLFVLEDAAQCFLGSYHGRWVGTLGHAASFSLQSSKHLASGEGGLITTDDEALANAIRRFSSLGYRAVGASAGAITKDLIQHPTYLRHEDVGFNYRMSELCAAVALGQVERMSELVGVRTHAAALLARAVEGCEWLMPQHVPEGFVNSYWAFTMLLDPGCSISWDQFRDAYLQAGGDPFYGCWQLSYLEPALLGRQFSPSQRQRYEPGLCPVAEWLQPNLIQLQTNHFEAGSAERQAAILHEVIAALDPRA